MSRVGDLRGRAGVDDGKEPGASVAGGVGVGQVGVWCRLGRMAGWGGWRTVGIYLIEAEDGHQHLLGAAACRRLKGR